jgi:uncharacterized protein with von Willebrand factor type A (vWA) domain
LNSVWQNDLALQRINDFAQFLRANKLIVDTGSLLDLHHLASGSHIHTRQDYRCATRACICRCPRDWHRFDALFDAFWQAVDEPLVLAPRNEETRSAVNITSSSKQRMVGLAGTSEKQQQVEEYFGAGDFKALSLADFRFVFNQCQMRAIERLVERAARRAKRRVSRREVLSHRGSKIDLRKSFRSSLRYAGRPVDLSFRRKKPRLRRFVLILDISQSMDVYARLFMRFTRILMATFHRSDAFVFNTDLSKLGSGHTRLSEADFERVLNRLGKGWLGGTRIAQSLGTFIDNHMMNCVDNKTTVLIFSDGCDTAKPVELAERVKIIRRCAGKLVWVNPLLGRFEPGEVDKFMDPVVPYIDCYLSAHNLDSLMTLEQELLS